MAIKRDCLVFLRTSNLYFLFNSQVKAYDADTSLFGNEVRYFLKEGDADLFRINASTGHIFLQRPLDREQVAEYSLTVVAMDTGEFFFFFFLFF